ncbi:MAG: CHAT domain-containing protein, partial [Bacteroidota bacterium]
LSKKIKKQLKDYQQLAFQLYENLLAPVLQEFNAIQKLLIIPDGMLGYLPFELLLEETTTIQNSFRSLPYLLKEYSIRYEYSVRFLLPSKTDLDQPLSDLLAFAPNFESNDAYSKLAFNALETTAIQELIGGKTLTGIDATAANFKSLAEQYGILHIASHASVRDSAPNFSHLVFTPNKQEDHLLNAYELYGLSLHAQLAVLSACETGTGQLQTGEGIMSLSRAFQYAGCSSIITSLWKAEDQSTYQIMVQLYKMLREGKDKDEALRQAKLDFLAESEQQYTHPFYWGTFVLIGNEKALIFKHSFQWEMLFLFMIALIAIGSIFLLGRRVKFKSNG